MIQKYIFSMYKREEKDGEPGEMPSTPTSFCRREKEKKIPNYLGLRICPNKNQTYALKS